MKKILCEITEVTIGKEVSDQELKNRTLPKVGDKITVERQDCYPFIEGGSDGEGLYKNKKDGGLQNIYYIKLKQLSLLTILILIIVLWH